ncbi:MAG TPA: response regulator, partial [Hyphomicrobium sp.]|nr:response regulator [Hyphomicrobium sp.]
MRILIVEDDSETATYIAHGLAEEGHVAEVLGDGRDGLSQAMGEDYDIIVVDRMLPGLDGLSLVRGLRAVGRKVPVIFLTSLGGVDDRVDGLNVGG